jgi:SP family galactose:H+ symporter-like MFS transporter
LISIWYTVVMNQASGRHHHYIYLATIISAVGGMLFGYDTGIISGAILFLKQQFHLSSTMEEVVVSAVLIGAVIGSFCGGFLADKYGRRHVIITAAIIFVLSSIETAFAGSIAQLIIGRIIVGIAIGLASFSAPLYISEISIPRIRGKLVGFNQLAVTLGILIAYLVGFGFSFVIGNWHWMFLSAVIPAAILGIGMYFMPPSPRWLMKQGSDSLAKQVLQKLRQSNDIEEEVEEIEAALRSENAAINIFKNKKIRSVLIIGILLSIIQQVTGINTIIYYSATIFKMANAHSDSHAILSSVYLGICNVFFTIVSMLLIDHLGRRKLLLISLSGMILGLVLLAITFMLPQLVLELHLLALVSIFIFIAAFAIGLGPIFWLLTAELYPLEVRGKCMSTVVLINWLFNLIVGISFLSIVDTISISGTFWLFAGLSVLSLIYIYRRVPETKGKTLEQIQQEVL